MCSVIYNIVCRILRIIFKYRNKLKYSLQGSQSFLFRLYKSTLQRVGSLYIHTFALRIINGIVSITNQAWHNESFGYSFSKFSFSPM